MVSLRDLLSFGARAGRGAALEYGRAPVYEEC